MSDPVIYLASQSPRRRELLAQLGVAHHVLGLREASPRGPDVDEEVRRTEDPMAYVQRLAAAKAAAGLAIVGARGLVQLPVLGADTTIDMDGQIVGKPRDPEHAVQILMSLAGRAHRVLCAIALAHVDRVETRLSVNRVRFCDLDEARVRRYVAAGESLDKAGAYAIQGRAAAFVVELHGSYSGVMGLPLAETAEVLTAFGVPVV